MQSISIVKDRANVNIFVYIWVSRADKCPITDTPIFDIRLLTSMLQSLVPLFQDIGKTDTLGLTLEQVIIMQINS